MTDSADLTIKHGDTRDWTITLSDADGARFDLTDSSVLFRVKSNEVSLTKLFSRDTDGTGSDHISISSPASSGIITITPTISDWSVISDYGTYVGEVEVIDVNSRENLFQDLNISIQQRLKHPSFGVESTTRARVLIPAFSERVSETDVVMDVDTSELFVYEWDLSLTDVVDLVSSDVTYTSSNTDVLTVDNDGVVTWVSNGSAFVTASIGAWKENVTTDIYLLFGYHEIVDFVWVWQLGGDETYELVNWVAGSLAKHANDSVDTLIAGKDPSTDQDVFTSRDHVTPAYVRNTNCWAQGLDLTAWSAWNTRSAAWGLVAITDDCICLPWHLLWQFGVPFIRIGDTVRFVAGDNTVVDRTITDTRRIEALDLGVCSLSSALPVSIKPTLLLPVNAADYLPHMADNTYQLKMATFSGDGSKNALVRDLLYIMFSSTAGSYKALTSVETTRALFSEDLISGDSGSPCGMVINGELVYVGTWSSATNDSSTGWALHRYLTQIQTAMDEMGCTGTFSYVDLSGFPTY